MNRTALASLLILASTLACAAAPMQPIVVTPDGKGFMEKDSHRPYIPFGTNYFDPNVGWAPKLWRRFDADRVRTQFDVMQSLGVNCARVFTTAASFQPTAETIEQSALTKLDKMIEIACDHNIRLILTGPDHWEGTPPYWRGDRFAGSRPLSALEKFWTVVAARYRNEPAIFAWDLLNEPQLPWSNDNWRPLWNDWLKDKYGSWSDLRDKWSTHLTASDKWGDIAIPADKPAPGDPRLRDYQLFREHLTDRWVSRQTAAIRRADPSHLITIGYIQWSYPLVRPGNPSRYAAFNPRRQAPLLDFTTIHFYPVLGNPFQSDANYRKNIGCLRAVTAYCHTSIPVVLGEFGWYGGGSPQNHPFLTEDQQADWIAANIEATRALVTGWLTWPLADTPSSRDISLNSGLVKPDLSLKAAGREFARLAADLPSLRLPTPDLPQPPDADVLTADSSTLEKLHADYADAVRRALQPHKN